ncbi:hypothetical protein ACQP04_33435 [Pseudonocardia halophobica]|uniref:hypothetical protein n=1 Tax=Pseudonocardia halophobica TaxID=29401 RepID=UPI003D8CFD7B
MKKRILCTLALGGALLPIGTAGTAGTALAAEAPTGDLAQGASATQATAQTATTSFLDAANGNGPTGADGLETEFPDPSFNYLDGPAGGLLNGPFD